MQTHRWRAPAYPVKQASCMCHNNSNFMIDRADVCFLYVKTMAAS